MKRKRNAEYWRLLQVESEACAFAFDLGMYEAQRFAVEHDRLLELGEHLRAASDEAIRAEILRRGWVTKVMIDGYEHVAEYGPRLTWPMVAGGGRGAAPRIRPPRPPVIYVSPAEYQRRHGSPIDGVPIVAHAFLADGNGFEVGQDAVVRRRFDLGRESDAETEQGEP